ncbi:MAG: glycosyl hydrolase [Ignavibacteriales bacterium]|nr:glycosyl hydrolase [Ignavibacteriales bacterium]
MKLIQTFGTIIILFCVTMMSLTDLAQAQNKPTKSPKRGICFGNPPPASADFTAISSSVSWWYNWGSTPGAQGSVPSDFYSTYDIAFIPMLWNQNFDATAIKNFILAHPEIQYLLVMNEPNLTTQANRTPAQAALDWPKYEQAISDLADQGRTVYLVGPQITYGTMSGYTTPVAWLDAFYTAYQSANGGKSPKIDYLGYHWYDYGLSGKLDELKKYGKKIWITEMANWHSQKDGAQIDSYAKQKVQMQSMVNTCETRSDVFRYAWFIGRGTGTDNHYSWLFTSTGQLSELGQLYLNLPFDTLNGMSGVENEPVAIVKTFCLEQNYPNPFNPGTNFTYRMSKTGFVSIKVFDLLGREVATLVNEVKQAGGYSIKWNASAINSGVYFCKMQTGPFVETKKIILMK